MKKRVLAMFLAATMAMAMPCMAFATETDGPVKQETESNETYTMSFEEKGKVAHDYKVYQIFSGTLFKDEVKGYVLSDIEWGSSIKDGSVTISDETEPFTDASKFAKYLETKNDSDFEGIKKDIVKSLGEAYTTFTSVAGSKCDVKLPAGYYLIEDVTPEDKLLYTDPNNEDIKIKDTKSSYVIQLVGNVEVAAKVGSVTSEKKVDDINDSTNVSEKLQDSADYDIGDSVPFTITGTLPANYDKYKSFYYAFHDVMEKGLTFNNDVKVYLEDGREIDNYSVIPVKTENDKTEFTVEFQNLKDVQGVTADSKIIVKYTCTLNEGCVVGAKGNINESWLEYSNNPDVEGHGETPHDNNIVFTYRVVVNKVDDSEPHKPLTGAEFKIEKLEKDAWVEKEFVISENGTKFSIEGVDDGRYRLTETKAPDGYNIIKEPLYFVIKADHLQNAGYIIDSKRDKILETLDAVETKGQDQNFVEVENKDNIVLNFTASNIEGTVSTDVVNTSGSTLPSTGGMGTTIFYLLGGVLVIGAGAVLFTRRRVDAK